MNVRMEIVRLSEPPRTTSPLAAARLHRQLTVEEAARRAGLPPDEVTWLEEGRVYRFPSSDRALLAALLYASALGIDHREARILAGLPVRPVSPEANPVARVIGVSATLAALAGLLVLFLLPGLWKSPVEPKPLTAGAKLPPPWKIAVDVLNGNGDINHTRRVATRIGAMAYRVERVTKADRFDYPSTAVFYEPGGQAIAVRLARQLGVATKPLPGGKNPRRLVVIVGPPKGPGG